MILSMTCNEILNTTKFSEMFDKIDKNNELFLYKLSYNDKVISSKDENKFTENEHYILTLTKIVQKNLFDLVKNKFENNKFTFLYKRLNIFNYSDNYINIKVVNGEILELFKGDEYHGIKDNFIIKIDIVKMILIFIFK